jgi:hypothetical protein
MGKDGLPAAGRGRKRRRVAVAAGVGHRRPPPSEPAPPSGSPLTALAPARTGSPSHEAGDLASARPPEVGRGEGEPPIVVAGRRAEPVRIRRREGGSRGHEARAPSRRRSARPAAEPHPADAPPA